MTRVAEIELSPVEELVLFADVICIVELAIGGTPVVLDTICPDDAPIPMLDDG